MQKSSKKRKYEVSTTYDGIDVVSLRFQAVYTEAGLTRLCFSALPDDPSFFSIIPERAVVFDAERRKTRFLKPCPKCGKYESVVGATPVCLKEGYMIGDLEFVRTDLEFGSNDEKSPLILCGEVAAKALSSAKLKGLELIAVNEPSMAQS